MPEQVFMPVYSGIKNTNKQVVLRMESSMAGVILVIDKQKVSNGGS